MPVTLTWPSGGSAQIIQTDGITATVLSATASPPGSCLVGKCNAADGAPVRFKVHGCKASGNGSYTIAGRWVDLTRGMREAILARMGS